MTASLMKRQVTCLYFLPVRGSALYRDNRLFVRPSRGDGRRDNDKMDVELEIESFAGKVIKLNSISCESSVKSSLDST